MGGEFASLQDQAERPPKWPPGPPGPDEAARSNPSPGAGKPRDKLGFVWTSRDLDRGGSDYLLGFVWTSWDRDRGGSDYLGNS